jgi:hypothetical protein
MTALRLKIRRKTAFLHYVLLGQAGLLERGANPLAR